MKNKIILTVVVIVGLLQFSCNDFLDTIPDNRTEPNTDQKITDLLVYAYTQNLHTAFTETMSDNIDFKGVNQSNVLERLQEYSFVWGNNIGDSTWDSAETFWSGCYKAISHANMALEAIEKAGNPARLAPQRGEALVCRAFNHFLLVNVFCHQFNPKTSNKDLGIPYITTPETVVKPKYSRGTVAEVYQMIEKDLSEGMPLISDNTYVIPKYHFNSMAVHAFAARFYLFYGKYDEVIKNADIVLGNNPINVLSDFSGLLGLTAEYDPWSKFLTKPEHNWNLLLMGPTTMMSVYFGNYSSGKRYAHCEMLAKSETTMSDGPWGAYGPQTFHLRSFNYTTWISTAGLPYLFEYTDPVGRTGYAHTVYPMFTTDETLLCRAEALIMKDDFNSATKDLALWMKVHAKPDIPLTRELINDFYSNLDYYEWNKPTLKKRINIEPAIIEGSEKENYLHCLLHFRRIQTIHNGMRWFDIKRFGIEVTHRELNANQDPVAIVDILKVDDPRRAVQLPKTVIEAGMTPNPR